MSQVNQQEGMLHESRVERGECPACGQQLYRLEGNTAPDTDGLMATDATVTSRTQTVHRVPLTIPNQVERGQCLACTVLSPSDLQPSIAGSSLKLPPGGSATAVSALFEGEYNDMGQKHGKGTMRWSNGDIYTGDFLNDVRHGHGTLSFYGTRQNHDGGEYVGDWEHNQMHGNGTRRYPNGDVYTGAYNRGQRQGEGRFYYANGDLYHGDFAQNHLHGKGRYYYASGTRFEGSFYHSKRSGVGKTQRKDGTLEVFQYLSDQRVGQGVRWSQDRTKAWRLTSTSATGGTLAPSKIPVAEAVSLVYDMEQAAAASGQDPEGELI